MPVAAGGIIVASRIDVQEDVVKGAQVMHRKFSLAGPGDPDTGLPINGARIGIECDPKNLTDQKLRSILLILKGQLNTNLGTAASIGITSDQLNNAIDGIAPNPQFGIVRGLHGDEQIAKENLRAIFQKNIDRPISQRHRHLTDVLTGFSAAMALEEVVGSLRSKHIVVQGFGAVGGSFAHIAERSGAKIDVIANTSGCFDSGNTKISNILLSLSQDNNFKLKPQNNVVPLLFEDPREAIGQQCDMLVLAGPSRTITRDDISRIKAKMIVQLANVAVVPDAIPLLEQKGIPVLPFESINIGNAAAFAIAQMSPSILNSHDIASATINHVRWVNEQIIHIARKQKCSLTEAVNIAINKSSLWKHIKPQATELIFMPTY